MLDSIPRQRSLTESQAASYSKRSEASQSEVRGRATTCLDMIGWLTKRMRAGLVLNGQDWDEAG